MTYALFMLPFFDNITVTVIQQQNYWYTYHNNDHAGKTWGS